MMSFEDEKNGRRTAETPEAAPLKAEALTDIDDDLISDAMEKIEKGFLMAFATLSQSP